MKKLFVPLLLVCWLLGGCYISKNLDREVKVSFNTDFPISITSSGMEGFLGRYSDQQLKDSYIEGLKGELESNKVTIVSSGAEFIVNIESFSTEETSSDETVDDESSSEYGQTFTLSSIDNKSNGSIKSSSGESLGSWSAYKTRNEKLKDRTKNDGTTTHSERAFDDDAAFRFAEKAGRRAGARIVNDIHAYLKKKG